LGEFVVPFDLATWAIATAIAGLSYIIFGITAFGAAMFTVPLLSLLFPLQFVLPLCVLLNVAATLALGSRFSKEAEWQELKSREAVQRVAAVLILAIGSSLVIRAF
jgi:uncharacterized membrane protein YfcA